MSNASDNVIDKLGASVGDWPAITRRLLNGDLDVAVAEISEFETDDRLEIEPLPRHRGVVFVRNGHPLTRRRGVTPDDVGEYPLVCTERPRRLAELIRARAVHRRLAGLTNPAVPDLRVDTFDLARQIVEAGDAVGFGVRSQIRSALRAGRLALLPLDLPWLTTNYGIIRLAGRTPSPLLVEFMSILRKPESEIRRR